jgi:hypothetical protein
MAAAKGEEAIMTESHEAALEYHRSQLAITLCKHGSKKPYAPGWPAKRYTVREINQEFRAHDGRLNVGVILGPRSKLVDLEYDSAAGEQDLLDLFDGDVPVTPTWQSRRSPHRLFSWHPDLAEIGKASIKFGGLEVRLGANCKGAQSLLPPSIADGNMRKWQVSLGECYPAPLPNYVVKRLLQRASAQANAGPVTERQRYRDTEETERLKPSLSLCNTAPDPNDLLQLPAVFDAIRKTVPSAEGYRERFIFTFARHLKAIPSLADADLDELMPVLKRWHEVALPHISTKEFEVSLADFARAWTSVKFPIGQDLVQATYEKSLMRPLSRAAEQYQAEPLRRLVMLCRELQQVAGAEPFYLACRTAGELLGIKHTLANKWLNLLVIQRILEVTTRGTQHRATRYRYLGD